MKNKLTLLLLLLSCATFAQDGAPASPYYDNMDWNLTGMALKSALATKITTTHTNYLTYSQVWNATQVTDLDPTNSNNVLLLYGFSPNTCPSSPTDDKDHRSRDKFSNGGSSSCEWNREHVYAKALASPPLDDGGASDAGEDAHHLRASDVDRNNDRSSEKFAAGSGNSGDITSTTWYPGDEWKGDVARMMMYMYLHYGSQCLPINVGVGNPVANDTDMIDLFLQWNAEDPVSEYEDNRNTYHGNTANTYAQGNRNPFIDNPYLATVIWGGPAAENRWPTIFLSSEDFDLATLVNVYPNPTNNNTIFVSSPSSLKEMVVYNINGQVVQEVKNPNTISSQTYQISNLNSGFYMIKVASENATITKKIIVN